MNLSSKDARGIRIQVALVLFFVQVLYSRAANPDSMPRVLVTAPSNAAVDELARKLISVQRSIKEAGGKIPTFRMVRLGVPKSVHPEVKEYTFDRIVEVMVETDMRKNQMSESLEKDLRTKQSEANQLASAQMAADQGGNSDLAAKLARDVAEKTRQLKDFDMVVMERAEEKAVKQAMNLR